MESFKHRYVVHFKTVESTLREHGWGNRAGQGAAIVLGALLFDRFAAAGHLPGVACPWRRAREHGEAMAALDQGTIDAIAGDLSTFRYRIEELRGTGNDDVDPSVIDTINEDLARGERAHHRPGKGTVYTSHAETSFMARLAMARHLATRVTGLEPVAAWRLAFDLEAPADAASRAATRDAIDAIAILDPCCGSGSFLLAVAGTVESIRDAVSSIGSGSKAAWRAAFCAGSLRGHDIDARAIEGTRLRLWCWVLGQASGEMLPDLPCLDGTLVTGDFLLAEPVAGKIDVVIGNPPYIRQEDAGTRAYKESVTRTWANQFPDVAGAGKACDYYVHFFFASMGWLRDNGTLCLLASNTWLDARYGKVLQGFMLLHAAGIAIIDQVARSFEQADVNTTITLATRRPGDGHGHEIERDDEVRFVKLREPLARIDGSMAWQACHGPPHPGARAVSKRELLAGAAVPDPSRGHAGGKWRALHLDAPEIHHRFLKHAAPALVRLGEVATVRAGCYTGLNAFFYVDHDTVQQFGIEPGACKPLVRSARSLTALLVDGEVTREPSYQVLCIPPASKKDLIDAGMPGVVAYIEWGEKQCTSGGQKTRRGIPWPEVASFTGRPYWYVLPAANVMPARHFMQYIAHDRFYCPRAGAAIVPDRCFHRVFPVDGVNGMVLHALLNSSIQAMLALVAGRRGLGGGAMKLETSDARDMLVLDPRRVEGDLERKLCNAIAVLERRPPGSMFSELGITTGDPPWDQDPAPLPDRLALDVAACEVAGVDPDWLPDIHRATCGAIHERVTKARSLPSRRARRDG